MADSTRPPAPFLAPEIISNILHFVQNKGRSKPYQAHREIASLTRINSGWKDEAQRRLFERIWITKSVTVIKLVLALESTPRLGRFILSLRIEPSDVDSPILDAHLVFQLLSSIPNLTYFSFVNPSFDSFSQEDSTAMQLAPLLLPKLTTLYMDAGRDKPWKREVFDEILINAPDLTELSLHGGQIYQGPMWKSNVPAKLKKLITAPKKAVLEGKVFPVAQFKGLKSLTIGNIREAKNNQGSFLPFFEAVGPTLVEMDCDTLPAEIYPFLTVLERVKLSNLPLDDSSPPKLLLPSRLISLKISDGRMFDEETTLPITAWSHLTLLEELHLVSSSGSLDLNELAPLKKITIHHCEAEDLLESLKNLSAGQFVIGELELLNIYDVDEEGEDLEDFDGEEIRKRCEELGIKYTLTIYNS